MPGGSYSAVFRPCSTACCHNSFEAPDITIRVMISIVIPTYNRSATLQKCVESILPQRYADIDLIIVDDGSTDTTGDWLASMQQEHHFIQVIKNEKNAGVNYARNRGIEKARGSYILFLDSDEQLLPGALATIRTTIQAYPHCRFFLFLQEDRFATFKSDGSTLPVSYETWIRNEIRGDFIHVVAASTMKQFPFFEQFRMFEYLNWLRIKKATSPLLLQPVVVARRETGRADSLTRQARLTNAGAIRAQFESKKLFYHLYYADLLRYHARLLGYPLLRVIALGVASNRRADCRSLLRAAGKAPVRIAAGLIMLMPAIVVRQCILLYTAIK